MPSRARMPAPLAGLSPLTRTAAAARPALAALGLLASAARLEGDAAPHPRASRRAPGGAGRAWDRGTRLDGDVLGDPAWAAVPALTGFWQITPDAGAPASQPTEVRILFTDDTLYFGVVCRDARAGRDRRQREPPRLGARRDRQLPDHPRHLPRPPERLRLRHQPGRPRVRRPGHERGRGRRRHPGPGSSLGGFNKNWDASWTVRTRSGDFGWSAEFAIPFSTLRYDRGKAPVWGLNFQRNIRRRNEQAFWAPLPRQYDLFRLSRAGTLAGLEPPRQRNLKLSPYALGAMSESPATGPAARHRGRGGRRAQVERDAEPRARRHRQHRLRPGRGGRAADQPRPLQPLLSREAPVLPRERRLLHDGDAGRGGPLLQPAHRDRARGPDRADPRRRAALGQARGLERRPRRHADARRPLASRPATSRRPASRASCPTARGSGRSS